MSNGGGGAPARLPGGAALRSPVGFAVQIPPSTTYAVTPMKRPMEEDGEEKSPSKKKKKIQKKGIELSRGRCSAAPEGPSRRRAVAFAPKSQLAFKQKLN